MFGAESVFSVSPLERTGQSLPPFNPDDLVGHDIPRDGFAHSVPLHDLAYDTPITTEHDGLPDFSFSNDEMAPVLDQIAVRTSFIDYLSSPNRVALVVGESALASALPYLEEDTIIMLDISEAHVNFMTRYVRELRQQPTISKWMDAMDLSASNNDYATRLAIARLEVQIEEWESSGFAHAFSSQDAYDKAHELANKKALIPWRGSISNRADMTLLGNALKRKDATITLANLSNAVSCDYDPSAYKISSCEHYASTLGQLPFIEFAPILTTSESPRMERTFEQGDYITESTGPFFGLRNLGSAGGYQSPNSMGCAVAERQYHLTEQELPPLTDTLDDFLLLTAIIELTRKRR